MKLDSPGFSRRLAVFGLVAAPVLFALSSAVEPAWSDDAGTYLAEVADHQSRHAAWGGLFALGALVLLPGLLGTTRLLRGPRGAVGQVGAVALAVSALLVGGLVLAISVTEIAMVDAAADRAQMVALYEKTQDLTFATVVFGILWFGGILLATLVLAVGLLLRRIVPFWSPLLLVGWLASTIALPDVWGSVVGAVLLLGAFAPLAHRMATLTDEEWARWQPLESAERRAASSSPELSSSARW
jgi:hypothetical protein